jgi:hypothetical protein
MAAKVDSASAVKAYLAKLKPAARMVSQTLRQLVLEAVPGIQESLKWGMPCYSHNGMVCYISPAKAHVSFGFYRGTELTDPQGLLEGEGNKMRHVKVRSPEDIRAEQFSAWVREAVALNEA